MHAYMHTHIYKQTNINARTPASKRAGGRADMHCLKQKKLQLRKQANNKQSNTHQETRADIHTDTHAHIQTNIHKYM